MDTSNAAFGTWRGTRTVLVQASLPHRWWPFAARYFFMACTIAVLNGKEYPWQGRHEEEFSGHRTPFGAAVHSRPDKVLATKLQKFGPGGVPGVFLRWHMRRGGTWNSEYVVAYWPDFQSILFGEEDKGPIFEEMQQVLLKKGIPGTPANMEGEFVTRVRSNLHIIFCMSPMGEAYRERLRKFPAIVNCSTLDWFTN